MVVATQRQHGDASVSKPDRTTNLRVLLLTQFYPPVIGGEERHVRNLGAALAARGHQVGVATQAGPRAAGTEQDGAVAVHALRGTLQRVGALFTDPQRQHAPPIPDPELTLGLRRLIAREQPDIIHAHNWMLHSFIPLKPFIRAPLVVTLHDYSLVCARKNFMHQGQPCSGPAWLKCLRCANDHYHGVKGSITALGNWANGALERQAVNKFLAVSGAVARFNNLAGGNVPFEVVPNFVPDNISELSTEPLDAYLSHLPGEYILFVGDLHPQKGVGLLLDAYARLASPPPLVLIGRRFAETPVTLPPGAVVFESWPHAAIMHAWRRCLFGVAPSIWHEPCATVVLEGMAQAKPMVVTDMGGMPDLVDHGTTGLVMPPDPASIAHALATLIADPDLRQRMGTAGLARVANFKASTVVDRIQRVYQELLTHSPADARAA
jgi:glycosyltransferase involved in cell wall biosynthesis